MGRYKKNLLCLVIHLTKTLKMIEKIVENQGAVLSKLLVYLLLISAYYPKVAHFASLSWL